MDREKVIKGLECCIRHGENAEVGCGRKDECPYEKNGLKCWLDLNRDALALLNEQKEEIENLKQTCQSMMEGVCLLKEQEAVEPRVSTAEQRCGNCNKVIEMDGWKACPWCGKMIDWEGWWKKNGTRNQDT